MITATWTSAEGRQTQEFADVAAAQESWEAIILALPGVIEAKMAAGEREDIVSYDRLAERCKRLRAERNAIAEALNDLRAGGGDG